MFQHKTIRGAIALAGVLSLSACLGNGGGAGGGAGAGGAGGGTAYDAAYSAIINEKNPTAGKIPTSDMPTSGTAVYTGQTQLDMRDGGQGGAVIGKLTGDVNLTATLKTGVSTDVSGTASNFEFVDTAGTAHAVDGTLATGSTAAFMVNVTPAQNIQGYNIPEIRAGAATIDYRGSLSGLVDGTTEAAEVQLLGGANAFGPGGESIAGPVTIQSFNTQTGAAPIYGVGTIYMNK